MRSTVASLCDECFKEIKITLKKIILLMLYRNFMRHMVIARTA